MDWLESLGKIIAVLLPVLTALGTIYTIRNSNKTTNVQVKKVESSIDIDNAQKINTVTMVLIDEIKKRLDDCNQKKDALEQEHESFRMMKVDTSIKYKRLAERLRDILDAHEKLASESESFDCKGYEIVNQMIRNIIDEIEKEVQL